MKAYIVRHPLTEWNKQERMQGWLDSPLTEEGKAVAHMIGEKLMEKEVTKIFTSDLGRCKETTNIINAYLKVPVTEVKELRELNFGKWGGQLKADENVKQLEENPDFSPPDGESFHQVQKRVVEFVNQLSEDSVLIVTHGGCSQTLLAHILHKPIGHESCQMKQDEIITLKKNDQGVWKVLAHEKA